MLFRVAQASRAALAAMAAWAVGNLLPGEMAQYAYAAALGAFVATGTTLVTIARAATQRAAGLVIGAALGLLLLPLDVYGLLKIGVIAALGVLVEGVRALGDGASMVPVAAVLVILFGGVDADGYAIGYVGQFSLGMLVGITINAVVMPPLHVDEARGRKNRAIGELADRLDELAAMLRGVWPPDREDWANWAPELEAWVVDVEDELGEARESRRFNIRTLWRRDRIADDEADGAALRSVVNRAINVIDALSGAAWETPVAVHVDGTDRDAVADAVAAAAAHLRAWAEREDVREVSDASLEAIDRLYARAVEHGEPQSGVLAVVFSLRALRARVDRVAQRRA